MILELVKIVLLGPVNDMKKTPGTSLSVIFVWLLLGYGVFVVYPKLAQAADVVVAQSDVRAVKDAAQAVQASVASLDRRLRYDGMRRDLEQVESDLGAVDREITRLSRMNMEPTDFLLDRQQRLVSRRTEIGRQLDSLIRQYPELVSQ